MGLDTTHDCWHGAYSAFMRWRRKLCQVAGLPPLDLMENFYEGGAYDDVISKQRGDVVRTCLPIRWEALRPSPLYLLLHHSDCDGEILAKDCVPIAEALEKLLPLLDEEAGGHIGNFREKTRKFIDGLLRADKLGENVGFH